MSEFEERAEKALVTEKGWGVEALGCISKGFSGCLMINNNDDMIIIIIIIIKIIII